MTYNLYFMAYFSNNYDYLYLAVYFNIKNYFGSIHLKANLLEN
jgi:hypothetical protein